jgi:hypothetical protein
MSALRGLHGLEHTFPEQDVRYVARYESRNDEADMNDAGGQPHVKCAELALNSHGIDDAKARRLTIQVSRRAVIMARQ